MSPTGKPVGLILHFPPRAFATGRFTGARQQGADARVVHLAPGCPQARRTAWCRRPRARRLNLVRIVRYEGERIVNETYTTVMGNIVGSVTRRELADGTAVANFRVASNERR